MSHFADRFTVLVDACCLAGALQRNMLLSLAEAEFYRIRWCAALAPQFLDFALIPPRFDFNLSAIFTIHNTPQAPSGDSHKPSSELRSNYLLMPGKHTPACK